MGLFEPKWKSKDEKKAVEAIKFLNKKKEVADEIFKEVILNETRVNVIQMAMMRLQDEEFMKQIYLHGNRILKVKGNDANRVMMQSAVYIHDQKFIENMIMEEKGYYDILANNINKENKNLAYDILSGKLKRRVGKDFYHNAVTCVGDKYKIYELAKTTSNNFVAEACVYGLRDNVNLLKNLAGTGTIIKYNSLADRFLEPKTVLKCEARKYLREKGIEDEVWLKPYKE